MSHDADVIVVGAGPVGLLTALGLARAGVSVRVLEAQPAIEDSARAIVYHWTVLEELDRLGILGEVKARGISCGGSPTPRTARSPSRRSATGALAVVVLDGADETVLDRWAEERRRIFVEIASPAASENKRIVYSEHDPDRRRADLAEIRRQLANPEALRRRLKFTELLRGDPVIY